MVKSSVMDELAQGAMSTDKYALPSSDGKESSYHYNAQGLRGDVLKRHDEYRRMGKTDKVRQVADVGSMESCVSLLSAPSLGCCPPDAVKRLYYAAA